MRKAVVVLSGGMDSATALYLAKSQGFDEVYAVSFNYGQRHVKELQYALKLANEAAVKDHKIIDVRNLTSFLSNSALTNKDIEVPEGHYAADSMKLTVVPNRNMIMYAVAIGYAVNIKAQSVFVGVHAGDHAIYPDCRPQFIDTLNLLARIGNEGFIDRNFEINAPFLFASKADIVRKGLELHVPYELTWSCYKGEKQPCLKCGTCIERTEAFMLANSTDPGLTKEQWEKAIGYVKP